MYRVLVADDEPIERMVVTKKLQKYFPGQLEVFQAANGREAVEIFRREGLDIALLDIEMPGINGLKAAEIIRGESRDVSIIFLTAFDEFSYAKRAISVKALDYILKPAEDGEIQTVIEEAMQLADQAFQGKSAKEWEEKSPPEHFAEEGQEITRIRVAAEKIRSYIEAHYREDVSLQNVAGMMDYSDAYFCKIFKQCFQKSFIMYLSEFRVEKAKDLLEDTMVNIKDVSSSVGYRDSNYFAKVFKRMTGCTPSDYRFKVLQNKKQDGK